MSAIEPQSGDWQSCRPGTLELLIKQIQAESRRRTLAAWAAVVIPFLLLAAGVWQLSGRSGPWAAPPGGIACDEVQRLALAYVSRQLAPSIAAQVDEHLRRCPQCRQKLREQSAGTAYSTAGVMTVAGHDPEVDSAPDIQSAFKAGKMPAPL